MSIYFIYPLKKIFIPKYTQKHQKVYKKNETLICGMSRDIFDCDVNVNTIFALKP